MDSRRFLPSRQFILLVVSLALSGGLVFAADRVTHPGTAHISVDTSPTAYKAATADWQGSLQAVQAASGISSPSGSDQATIEGLLEAAKSGNLTDSVSRSLFINLFNAKSQGLGDDIPTQEQLVKGAISQVDAIAPKKTYTTADLNVAADSKDALHAYGNASMAIFTNNSNGEFAQTLAIMDAAMTANDSSKLKDLKPIQETYKTIATELAATLVPKTLVPFHLALVNDYSTMAATYEGMQTLISDPLGGLAAVQQYRTLAQHAGQMFINIAQTLDKNAIIFRTDEPGATWSLLLQAQQ